jgi:hypothetical protein
MAETEELLEAMNKNTDALERLLETTQDLFILQCLQLGMAVHPVKSLLGVRTDRVTRISKPHQKVLRAKAKAKKDSDK